jgi:glycosyltransferase involved in cell wall biosynthesis
MIPRRIAYLVKVFPKLSETFIANELMELRRRGFDARVFSLQRPVEGLRHQIITRAGLDEVTSYEPDKFAGLLREFQPQLIHAHFATEPTAAARELSADLQVPFTFTAHGYDIRRKPPPDFFERALAARAVITVSQANARHIIETFKVPSARIHVIPCGVDTKRFQPADRGPLPEPKPSEPPLIVCVARHVKVKNLGLLLEACGRLRDSGVPFRCVVVGDGPCRGELEEARSRLRLEPWIEFAGAAEQGEVLAWWQKASMAVLTSESEGMPICLMEAAACAVPAVATAVGGIPELIVDGETGWLTPAGDAPALAAALQRFLRHPHEAIAFGQAARRRMEEKFALTRQVDRLLALWSEFVDE